MLQAGLHAAHAIPAVPALPTGLGCFLQVGQLEGHQVPQPGEQHPTKHELHLLHEQRLRSRLCSAGGEAAGKTTHNLAQMLAVAG